MYRPKTATLTEDALRYTLVDIEVYIRGVRGAMNRGNHLAARCHARDYLRLMKTAHELREHAIEQGSTGPLVGDLEPIPFRDQLVGYSAAERARLAWRPFNA